MKINYFWDKQYSLDEVGIQINPKNQSLSVALESYLNQENNFEVINPSNNRKSIINYLDVYLIEAMDHLSKIYTTDERVFYAKGRLKEFEKLSAIGVVRINNATMLNLNMIESFDTERYARLDVHTKMGETHIVSRHYANQIKEALICLKH